MKLVIAAAIILGLAAPAFAQPDPAVRQQRREERLRRFDHNHDGRLDRAERREAKRARREHLREKRRERKHRHQQQRSMNVSPSPEQPY